jgi:hypothetical protein
MYDFTLHEWEVSEKEEKAFSRLDSGNHVKVLYLSAEDSESNWCEILEVRDRGFLVEPRPCLFFDVPSTMEVAWENIKDVYRP